MTKQEAKKRLEEIRKAIEAENISYGELAELQALAEYIEQDGVQLLEWVEAQDDCLHNFQDGICKTCGEVAN